MKTLWPDASELIVASPHQRERYALATRGPVGILGGNPGVGKTHLVAQIIRALGAAHGTHQVAVLAPTGKAAQRLNEFTIANGINGIQATTIHRGLGVQRSGHDGRGWGFMYGRERPLPARFVIVDEGSMCGIPITSSLLAALRPGSHLLIVGDFAQLPPVDHGAPLRDMIAAGLPCGELTEVHRNGGDIVQACRDVKEGRPFRPSPGIDLAAGHNVCHVEADRPPAAVQALAEMLRHTPPGINPVWDTQVICAINEAGEVSRKALNGILQNVLNEAGAKVEGSNFRMGDKVICQTNSLLPVVECQQCNYGSEYAEWTGKLYHCQQCDATWSVQGMISDFVANGEIGVVTYLEKGLLHVKFEAPARTVRVAGNFVQDFELAYAISCHKAQGSQAPVVIVMADDSRGANMVCSWEWWRTAWSRSQRLCFTIGKLGTIHRHCRRSALQDRKTFLRELLANHPSEASQ